MSIGYKRTEYTVKADSKNKSTWRIYFCVSCRDKISTSVGRYEVGKQRCSKCSRRIPRHKIVSNEKKPLIVNLKKH